LESGHAGFQESGTSFAEFVIGLESLNGTGFQLGQVQVGGKSDYPIAHYVDPYYDYPKEEARCHDVAVAVAILFIIL
jgi:hypothetical protein